VPPAGAAAQQPGQQVPASRRAGRTAAGGQVLGGDEVGLADNRGVRWPRGDAAEDDELSNMKLQKLLYYAQGHHLAKKHGALFTGEIEAWSHGPVVPSVCRAFKDFGAASIELPDADSFSWDDVDAATAQFLGADTSAR